MIRASEESVDDDGFVDRAWVACRDVLHRAPIDRFEASVTLEAHHGLQAAQALSVGRRFAEQGRFTQPSTALPRPAAMTVASAADPQPTGHFGRLFGEVVFMVSVLIVGFWVSSMAAELGLFAVDRAWRIALPASLGAQWFLRRRYLSGEQGLGRLRRELPVAGIVLLAVAGAGLLGEGWLGAVLGTLWSAGFLIARRGWWLPQFGVLVAALVAHRLGVSGTLLLVSASGAAFIFAVIGVATSTDTSRKASPWHAGLLAAGVGAGLGALLVVEPEFVWSVRLPLPILTVVPSLLGSLWGAARMSALWEVLPANLRETPLSQDSGRAAGVAVRRLVLSSVARIALATFVGSVAVVWWAERAQHPGSTTKRLLVAHALLAVAGLGVSLLEGFGRSGQALFCVLVGVGFALLGPQWHVFTFPPASRILLAAAATTLCSLVLLLHQIRDPARSIAAGI
jgi:hypothetical protein